MNGSGGEIKRRTMVNANLPFPSKTYDKCTRAITLKWGGVMVYIVCLRALTVLTC